MKRNGKRIAAFADKDHAARAGGVGGAQNGAQIPRVANAFERNHGVAADLIERREALAVGADHCLGVVALADLGKHRFAGLDRVDTARFGLRDQSADLLALQRRGREHQDLRPYPEVSRFNRKARALGQEQTGFGASLFQMQALQRLDLRIGGAGDVVGHRA